MWTSVRKTFDLVGRDRPGRWAFLVGLSVVVSVIEMLGAVLVYTLLALVADPGGSVTLPLAGDLRARFDDVDEATFLLVVVAIMAVFFLLRGTVKVASKYAQSRMAHNAGVRLSTELVEGYLLWPYSWHLSRTSSELIRNGHSAVESMVNGVLLPAVRIAGETVIVVGLLVVLLLLAPFAALGAVAVVGSAALVLLLLVQPRLKALGTTRHVEAKVALAALQQSFQGIRDVKVLGRERFFARQYGVSRRRSARSEYLRETATQLPSIVLETALLAFILGFFAVTIVRGGTAQESLTVLGLFAYVGLRLQPSLQQIVSGLNSLKYATAALDAIYEDRFSLARSPRPPVSVEPLRLTRALELHQVSFRYEGTARDALAGIDLTIRPGQQIGICGPTGGGKTTLVDVITGLLPPTSGRVTVDGHDLGEHARAWQANLGVVPQMVFLSDDTLRRNIALGVPDAEIDHEAVAEAVRLAQLDEFVAALPEGLDTSVGERGVRVSGGQRQRIAIARALYRRPDVMIFDEGTSALDNTTEALLMDAIERLRGDRTILLVAHRLTTVRNCDQVVFLEHGRIAGLGAYEELCAANPSFRQMAGMAS